MATIREFPGVNYPLMRGVVKSRWSEKTAIATKLTSPNLIIIIIEVRPPQMVIKEKLYTNVAVS